MLDRYLPAQLSDAELAELVAGALAGGRVHRQGADGPGHEGGSGGGGRSGRGRPGGGRGTPPAAAALTSRLRPAAAGGASDPARRCRCHRCLCRARCRCPARRCRAGRRRDRRACLGRRCRRRRSGGRRSAAPLPLLSSDDDDAALDGAAARVGVGGRARRAVESTGVCRPIDLEAGALESRPGLVDGRQVTFGMDRWSPYGQSCGCRSLNWTFGLPFMKSRQRLHTAGFTIVRAASGPVVLASPG